jgi:hypothetical protein
MAGDRISMTTYPRVRELGDNFQLSEKPPLSTTFPNRYDFYGAMGIQSAAGGTFLQVNSSLAAFADSFFVLPVVLPSGRRWRRIGVIVEMGHLTPVDEPRIQFEVTHSVW